jgi:hypothetical protein
LPPSQRSHFVIYRILTHSRKLGYEIVHIRVGKEAKDFGIHKDLICHHSPYFNAAFNSQFKEAETGIMILEDTESRVFELFYQWLYTQNLWEEDAAEKKWPASEEVIMLYIFADKGMVTPLKDQIMAALEGIFDMYRHLSFSHFRLLWQNTSTSDPIRDYMADMIVWTMVDEVNENYPAAFPNELLLKAWKRARKVIDRYGETDADPTKNPLVDRSKWYTKNYKSL